MEVNNRAGFFAAIDPADSLSAAISETLEIDLEIDLVRMSRGWFLSRLSRADLVNKANEQAQ
jgi:hypothetical protein